MMVQSNREIPLKKKSQADNVQPPLHDARPDAERGAGGETQQLAHSGADLLTTRHGLPLSDNQNSLHAGPRGPGMLSDIIFLDKITHFDRERIPERVVHAHASAARGHFELTQSLSKYTTAKLLCDVGRRTPVFARLSTVIGPAGSADTVRDVRGFAVKFYTDQGNWDLVGNNIPVFFIQDAMKFPDLIHAAKREPDRGLPSASTAHDTFWDFISLMPESMHMVMWIMSDRTLPRSLAMMEGFGVHTFRLIDAAGHSTLVKYHWRPRLGMQSLLWEEAVQIAGADPDYHRRSLAESIEAGHYPAWDLAVQLLSEDDAARLPFDVLDPTKLIPEEWVPLKVIGRMVLDQIPDNFFAETEQVAFCPSHILPGMDFSQDPLLQGRILSYTDTQMHRLGGPNFNQLPVNRPLCPVQHYQRDAQAQQAVCRGRTAYEPNTLAPSGPRASRSEGQHSYREALGDSVIRARAESFSDHYSQARMFFLSQTDVERRHIAAALTVELSKVETADIRQRMVGHLRVIDESLATSVAHGLSMDRLPAPAHPARAPIDLGTSDMLSILKKTEPTLEARCIGVLIADGSNAHELDTLLHTIQEAGARVKIIAPGIGGAKLSDGRTQVADLPLRAASSAFFDAVALVLCLPATEALLSDHAAQDFVRDAYKHLKAIALSESSIPLLVSSGVTQDGYCVPIHQVERFIELAASRHWERTFPVPKAAQEHTDEERS